jgi:hypothetical protein
VVRAAALLIVAVVLAVYYTAATDLPDWQLRWDITFLALALIPTTFLLPYLALPARRELGAVRLAYATAGLAIATVALEAFDLELAANFFKLAAVTCLGWWFLQFFEAVTWVLLVAVLIVPVDIYSVARGPTNQILEDAPRVFDVVSIFFPIPGEQPLAQLGLPDVLFFALFLGAAERFALRVNLTWLLMALSFGGTLTIAVVWDVGGLPALPLLSLAFLLANGDLIWRAYRKEPLIPD